MTSQLSSADKGQSSPHSWVEMEKPRPPLPPPSGICRGTRAHPGLETRGSSGVSQMRANLEKLALGFGDSGASPRVLIQVVAWEPDSYEGVDVKASP
jgi:hypothetical protein